MDREKVIKGLEWILNDIEENGHYQINYYADEIRKSLALLKEQEAVEPILKREGRNKYYNYYVCPRCNEEVVYDQNYCSECGAKFIFEGR